jgi:transcriptional regulator GlxA family with amidase domain|tara:strand:+ start:764 stop:1774 length:1011 start_codon:yes stop_codon:yes gene_type:complete
MNKHEHIIQTPTGNREPKTLAFEIFVQHGFSEFELASITTTLQAANKIGFCNLFSWRFASDTPGLVKGATGGFVRADPSIPDHGLADWMIVVGSNRPNIHTWLKRTRSMSRRGLVTVLLSGAATAYIKATKITEGAITTHWCDAVVLRETDYYPQLTSRFSEKSGHIITAAGSGSTTELVVGLISKFMAPNEIFELASYLLIPALRGDSTEQPKQISDNNNLLDYRIIQAVKLMDEAIECPMTVQEVSRKMGVSVRQLERKFQSAFAISPAKFYRKLRVKRARMILEETRMRLFEVAFATGFSSSSTLSKAFRDEFGESPRKMRARCKALILQLSN